MPIGTVMSRLAAARAKLADGIGSADGARLSGVGDWGTRMSKLDNNNMPSDELLTAFIDGELEAAERDRMEKLIADDVRVAERFDFPSRSDLLFREAFEPVLARGPKRQAGRYACRHPFHKGAEESRFRHQPRVASCRRSHACLVVGIAIDRAAIGINHRLAKPDEGTEWRAVVAEYLSLYTPDTLSAPAGDHAEQAAQLSEVGPNSASR